MFCPNCGKETEGSFCPDCGTPIRRTAATTTPEQPEAPAKVRKKVNALGIIGFVFALLAFVLSLTITGRILCIIFASIAIALSAVGLGIAGKKNRRRGLSIAGLVIAIVACVFGISRYGKAPQPVSMNSDAAIITADITATPVVSEAPAIAAPEIKLPEVQVSVPVSVSVSEQVILKQDGITITLKSLDFSGWYGPEFKILIENNSNKNMTIQTRDSAVNGIMIDALISASVEPGKKINDAISFSSSDLEQAGILAIKDVEFYFHVFDTESWDTIFDSETVYITTDGSERYLQQYDDTGILLYEEGGLRVILQGLDAENSLWGADIFVYVENLTETDITIQLRDTSINGFMIDPVFSCEVLAGKRAYDAISVFQSDLTENGIADIENMEFTLHVFDLHSYKTIKKSEKLFVTFES